MKKKPFVLLMLLLISMILPVTVPAKEAWSEDYYRVLDSTGELSDTKVKDLDAKCLDFMKEYGTDLVLAAVLPEDYEGYSIEDLAGFYYDKYGFGYGENKSGLFVICDYEEEVAKVVAFGDAEGLVDDDYIAFVEDSVFGYKEEYGVYGVLYSSSRFLSNYFKDDIPAKEQEAEKKKAEAENAVTAQETKKAEAVTETKEDKEVPAESQEEEAPAKSIQEDTERKMDLPDWYVDDPEHFVFFHNDASTPRVVDDADIFSDQEERSLEEVLKKYREELDRDLVIFTDVSEHYKGRAVYAADFYEMNGYGCGPDYEGACLFICMDPNNRGWWACCSGPSTMGLYTEEVANYIDENLFPFMKEGNYFEGVQGWIEDFHTLYTEGTPLPPAWLPEDGKLPDPFYDANAPRIVDDAGVFDEDKIETLRDLAEETGEEYDLDIAVHTAYSVSAIGMTPEEYAEKFYRCMGYGTGKKNDGLLLVIFHKKGYDGSNARYAAMYASGKGKDKLTEVNEERLMGFVEDEITHESDNSFYASKQWITQVGHMQKTGRVPRSFFYWAWIALCGAVSGLIFGGSSLSGAKKRMQTPEIATNADQYLVKESVQIASRDSYLRSSSTRRYSPISTGSSSSSSSSGGRSSYSGSYHSSSGGSHSGSGRSF